MAEPWQRDQELSHLHPTFREKARALLEAFAAESLPLYDLATNIDIGTAEIKQRWAATGPDPIQVAAAFNAGGLYKNAQNPWRLRAAGDHLDRAARWYGDACAVLKAAQG